MSFEPIRWTYNPPPTLAPGTSVAAQAPLSVASSPEASRATQLLGRFSLLNDCARYLESAIVNKSSGRGMVLDLSTAPELAMALDRIYGSTPSGVSIGMYNGLLDAEVGMTRAEIVLGETGAAYQVDPVQQHDVQLVTSAFENAMLAEGSFDNQVPVMLRSLKNDRVVFDSLSAGLRTYSVLNQAASPAPGSTGTTWTPPAKPVSDPIDVNPDTADNLNERCAAWQQNYTDNYQLIATPSSLYGGVSQYSPSLSSQIASDLQTVLQVIRGLEALFFRPNLQTLLQDVSLFVWARLASEVSGFVLLLDQAVQKAVSPAQAVMSSFGQVFNTIQSQAGILAHLIGQGGKIRDAVAKGSPPVSTKMEADLNKIPAELAKIGGYIGWAQNETSRQQMRVEISAMRLLDIKLNFGQEHNQVLAALKDAEAVVSILTAFFQILSQRQSSILGTLTQAESAAGVVEDGVIQYLQQSGATATPQLPTPPANVQQALGVGSIHV